MGCDRDGTGVGGPNYRAKQKSGVPHHGKAHQLRKVQPLIEVLLSVTKQGSSGRVRWCWSDKIGQVESYLKEAIYEIHQIVRNEQEHLRRNLKSVNKAENHKYARRPGGLLFAPILEPLGNTKLPITNDSHISTPGGSIITKSKPQVCVMPLENGVVTAVIGSRQDTPLTEKQVQENPRLKKQFLRLLADDQKLDESMSEIGGIGITGGTFPVKASSLLDGAALNFVRYQDIEHCYSGSHVHQDSIPKLIKFLHQNNVDKLGGLADAHGLEMSTTLELGGILTAGRELNTRLRSSELEADKLLTKQKEGEYVRCFSATGTDTVGEPFQQSSASVATAREGTSTSVTQDQVRGIESGAKQIIGGTGDRVFAGTDTRAARTFQQMSMQKNQKRPRTDSVEPSGADSYNGGEETSDNSSSIRPVKKVDHGTRDRPAAEHSVLGRGGSQTAHEGGKSPSCVDSHQPLSSHTSPPSTDTGYRASGKHRFDSLNSHDLMSASSRGHVGTHHPENRTGRSNDNEIRSELDPGKLSKRNYGEEQTRQREDHWAGGTRPSTRNERWWWR